MRLALQALFCKNQGTSVEDDKRRERIENDLRRNPRSVDFFRKMRLVMGRPLEKAPEVFSDESFPDANIVAEYLDCQLESTEVSDEYEDVCYNSPEMLVEAADCYDLLNNCLCKPMSAPKNCRRRLYYVAWEEAAPPQCKKVAESTERYSERDVVDIKRPSSPRETVKPEAVIVEPQPNNSKITKAGFVRFKSKADAPKRRNQGRLQWGVKAALFFLVVAGGINSVVRWHNLENVGSIDSQEPALNAPGGEETMLDASQLAEESYSPVLGEEESRNEAFSAARGVEPIKVASLPVDEESVYGDLNANQKDDMETPEEQEPVPTEEERGEIYIPETNNNVFSGSTRY